jgi:RimJ/RimL family protein N-acetyltransferase/SAM-dependent methyltransferase
VILSGPRVTLRSARSEDAALLEPIRDEPEVTSRWGRLEPGEIDAFVAQETTLVIEADGEVIGAIQYEEEPDPMYRRAGIDIYLTAARHNEGLGSEAVAILARYLIEERGHHRLTIDPAADNAAAIRAYEKVGFRPVGVMRAYERGPDGTWHDGLLMELLADDLIDESSDPTGWFEDLYQAAERGEAVVPWDRGAPRLLLVRWAEEQGLDGTGRRALVVGCGLGVDAEFVAGLGFDTTAFDVAPSAVRAARRRFPGSTVHYLTADLFAPPPEWHHGFDLVVESHTVQSLPEPYRGQAIARVGTLVGPGGTLIAIAASRADDEQGKGPPWPLTRAEIERFATDGLEPVRIERMDDPADPGIRRWRAEFKRPAASSTPI